MAVGGSNRRADSGSGRRARRSAAVRAPKGDPLTFTFFSNVDEAHNVGKQIIQLAQEHGFTGDSLFAIRLSLEEALMNAVKHGNRLDPEKKIHVEAKVDDRRTEILIEDEGPGFDRASVPDPTDEANLHKCSGRGILLIEAYMSEVKWDRGGRRLRMVREK